MCVHMFTCAYMVNKPLFSCCLSGLYIAQVFLFVLCVRFEVLTVVTVKDFLPAQEFVPKGDWLHLDIASVMSTTENLPYIAKGMTGRPTRTIVEFISSLVKGST